MENNYYLNEFWRIKKYFAQNISRLATIVFVLSLTFFATQSFGSTITWQGDGSTNYWGTTACWQGGALPLSTDDVLIPAGSTVYVDQNGFSCNSITFQGVGTTSFQVNSTNHFTVSSFVKLDDGVTVNVSGSSGSYFNVASLNLNTGISSNSTLSLINGNFNVTGTTDIGSYRTLYISTQNEITTFTGLVTINNGGVFNSATVLIDPTKVVFIGGLQNNNVAAFSCEIGAASLSGDGEYLDGAGPIDFLGTVNIPLAKAINNSNTGKVTFKSTIDGTSGSSFVNMSGAVVRFEATPIFQTAGSTFSASAAGNIVEYGGATSTDVYPTTYAKLNITANSNCQTPGFTVNESLNLFFGSTLTFFNTVILNGNLNVDGTITGGGALMLTGLTTQIISNTSAGTINIPISVTLNNAAGLVLTKTVQIHDLSLSAGIVNIGNNDLLISTTINSGAPTTSFVATDGTGSLIINFALNASNTFPVGNNTIPALLDVNLSSGYGNIKVRSTNMRQPNTYGPDYVNRYWSVDASGGMNPILSLTGYLQVGDVQGILANLTGAYYTSGAWFKDGTVTSGTITTTTNISSTVFDYTGIENVPPVINTVTVLSNNAIDPVHLAKVGDVITVSIAVDRPLGTWPKVYYNPYAPQDSFLMSNVNPTHFTGTYTVSSISAPGPLNIKITNVVDPVGNAAADNFPPSTISLYPVAPTYQDLLANPALPNTVLTGATVTLNQPVGLATDQIWLAPNGTTTFAAGNNMTTVAGNATSIVAPTNPDTYYIFVIDPAGNVSHSSAALTVNPSSTVSGNVSGTWSNNVYVNGNITIPSNSTLNISAGTVVTFLGHYGIIVNGQLLANGAVNDSILFTTNSVGITWNGIQYSSSSDASPQSQFAYCIFERASAVGRSNGGAMWLEKQDVTVENSHFTNCSAFSNGGAIFVSANITPSTSIQNNFFDYNTSSNGGAIAVNIGSPTIIGNKFVANTASPNGGAISFNQTTSCTIKDNFIFNNYASGNGGAIYFNNSSNTNLIDNIICNNQANNGGAITFESSSGFSAYNNTIVNNKALTSGDALYFTGSSSITLTNSIVNNTKNYTTDISKDAGSSATFSYCLVSSTSIGTFDATDKTGDPKLASPTNLLGSFGTDGSSANWTPQLCSPAVDGGDNTLNSTNFALVNLVPTTTDINGYPRFFNSGTIDIGAIELQTAGVVSNAGSDVPNLCDAWLQLNANTPDPYSGTWSVNPDYPTVGSNVTAKFDSPTLPNAKISNISGTNIQLIWTVTDGEGCTATSSITIHNNYFTADAGADANTCDGTYSLTATDSPDNSTSGNWTIGSGAGSFSSPSTANAGLTTGLNPGANVFYWDAVDLNGCTAHAQVTINYIDLVANSDANTNSYSCDGNFNLSPAPTSYYGAWLIVSGSGSLPTGSVGTLTGLTPGTPTTLNWTVTDAINYCTPAVSQVTINYVQVTDANPGTDQTLCGNSTAMNAVLSVGQSGFWQTATSASISDISSENTGIANLPVGANIFAWTVIHNVSQCHSVPANVTITNATFTTSAGAPQTSCSSIATMDAQALITNQTGAWTPSTNFVNPTSNTSVVNSLPAGDNYFTWTVTDGTTSCTASSIVKITNNNSIVITNPNTGSVLACDTVYSNFNSSITNLTVAPAGATYMWTVVSGNANFINPTALNTGVTGLGIGSNLLSLNVYYGGCNSSTIVTVDCERAIANAGPDANIFFDASDFINHPNTYIMRANIPSMGSGLWSIKYYNAAPPDINTPVVNWDLITKRNAFVTLPKGDWTFTWTVTSTACNTTASSDVTIYTHNMCVPRFPTVTWSNGGDWQNGNNPTPEDSIVIPGVTTVNFDGQGQTYHSLTIPQGGDVHFNPNTAADSSRLHGLFVLGGTFTVGAMPGKGSAPTIKTSSITVEPETSKDGKGTSAGVLVLSSGSKITVEPETSKGTAPNTGNVTVGGSGSGIKLNSGSSITVEPETSKGSTTTGTGNITLGKGSSLTMSSGSSITVEPETSKGGGTIQGNITFDTSCVVIMDGATIDIKPHLSKVTAPGTRNVTAQSGSSITMSSGSSITVEPETSKAPIGSETGVFVLKQGAYVIDDVNATTTGINANVRAELTFAPAGWHFVSSPMVSQYVQALGSSTYVNLYNEPKGAYTAVTFGTPLQNLRGYSVEYNTAPTTFNYSGTLACGNYTSYTLTNTHQNDVNNIDGWHLLGNPYPSPVDWEVVFANSTNIDGSIYLYEGASGGSPQWGTYNASSGVHTGTVSQYIPPMQGFFAHISSGHGTGTVVMTNVARVLPPSPLTFFKSGAISDLLRLSVSSGTYSDDMVVLFRNDATDNFDSKYDAFKKFLSTTDPIEKLVPMIYSVTPDNTDLAISTIAPFTGNKNIPVGFKCSVAGTYTISLSENTLSSDVTIYLLDTKLNKTTDLKGKISYAFKYSLTDSPNRFVIQLGKTPTAMPTVNNTNGQNVSIYAANGLININSDNEITGNVEVYDVLGKLIKEQNISGTNNAIGLNGRPGIYIVRIVSSKLTISRKVIIN